jgi:DNA-binding IclR family transcriptional regulator
MLIAATDFRRPAAARHPDGMAAHRGDAEPTGLIRSVSRALRIIEYVGAAPRPVPVKVIARQCELRLATAYHLVRTLCYEGYLVRLGSGGYVVGPQVAERFHEMVGAFHRPPRAHAVLRHLAEHTNHTAYLASISADRLVVVDLVEGDRSPWLEDLQVGLETAAHATALGKALLTTLPRRGRRQMLAAHGMPRFTADTPTDPLEVEVEVSRVRPGELVTESGQFRVGVCCASVAVPGADPGTWWALGTSARGGSVPDTLLTALRVAAGDLTPG